MACLVSSFSHPVEPLHVHPELPILPPTLYPVFFELLGCEVMDIFKSCFCSGEAGKQGHE